ncbi:MAG TPA: M56 family metallopeptidase [Gemmatimonadaceae bacterium]|nr:M56 family metallopeptidase [Gemmatimonadaceae bacterium]
MLDFVQRAAEIGRTTPLLAPAALTVLKASAILVCAALVVRALKRQSAARRHLVWSAGITSALLLPLAQLALPTWSVAVRYTASETPAVASPIQTQPQSLANIEARAARRTASRELRGEARNINYAVNENTPALRPLSGKPEPGSARPERSLGIPRPTLAQAAIGIWLLGAVAALFPWALGVISRRRLFARASDQLPPPWDQSLLVLRLLGKIPARARVRVTNDCVTPMTWGLVRPIVLVPADTDWNESQRRNALLHEFAHVSRGDCVTQFLSRVMCAIYWFNPVAWVAARAERLAREEACDDAVIRAGSRPSAYAEQLLEVAHSFTQHGIAVAALTMARRSSIASRLHGILDAARDRSPSGRKLASLATCATFALVPPLAALTPELVRASAVSDSTTPPKGMPNAVSPADSAQAPAASRVDSLPTLLPSVPRLNDSSTISATASAAVVSAQPGALCTPGTGKRSSSNMRTDDGRGPDSRRWQVRWRDDNCAIELDARGTFTLSPNADDVTAISSRGYIDLMQQPRGGVERRVRIEPGDGTTLQRTYWVDGKRAEWNAEAARWFAQVLIMLDRRTAFAVDSRLPMLLQRGGVDAVLAEVTEMPTTYPQRVYYTKLFERQVLTTAQLAKVLETASKTFDSGYERAELLLSVAKQKNFADPLPLAYAQMVKSIDSDYERRRALSALLTRSDLAPAVVRTMLEASEGMESDYELAELLIGIANRYAVDDASRPYYVRAISSIDSDYEQRRVLSAIVAGERVGTGVTEELVTTAGRTMQGYELAEFLIAVATKGALDQSGSAAFFTATRNVGSDYERRRVLEVLLKRGQLTPRVVEGILSTASSIASDYECAELLIAVSRAFTIDEKLRPAYDRAAQTIESDYEYGRAMSAVRRAAQRSQ